MGSTVAARIDRRNDEVAALAARERERRPNQALAAIELCAESQEDRERDRAAVREALADGAQAGDIGVLFVTVVADLTYEIDWGDQFKFWPHLAESLGVAEFNVECDGDRRRETADAFDAFANRFGGVYPMGSFSSQFPLMSRPLVHSMLPKCAQRHVARLLAKASAGGELPTDGESPWPVDELVEMGEALSLPLFVRGLLENRAVLEPAGRALLGFAGSDPAVWARRIADTVRADAVTQDLVDRARRSVRNARTPERHKAVVSPRVSVAATQPLGGAAEAALWIELGPFDAAERSVEGISGFARSGAKLRVTANKKSIAEPARMVDALDVPLVVPYPSIGPPFSISVVAQAPAGSVPDSIREYFSRAAREVKFPIALKARGAARFTEIEPNESVDLGSDVIVAASDVAPIGRELAAVGFARLTTNLSGVALMLGVANEACSAVLARCGVDVRTPALDVGPILFPPSRRRRDEFIYPPGSEAWLRVRGASQAVRVEAEPPGHVAAFATEDGDLVVRVLGDDAVELRFLQGISSRPAARANIRFESEDPVRAARWRAALQPAEATAAHVVERLCWLRVDALPGVRIRFQLVATFADSAATSSATAKPEDVSTPLASMQFLDRLLDDAGIRPDTPLPEHIALTAWSEDEPERPRIVARVGASTAALRFEATEDGVGVAPSAGAVTVSRLEITPRGPMRTPLTSAITRSPGLYVASMEGVHVAACVAERRMGFPRLPSITPPPRSIDGLRESLALLRALDVAVIWPPDAFAYGLLLRRAAVRAVENALVGSLCGEEWLRLEEGLSAPGVDRTEALARLKYLTWISDEAFDEAVAEAEDGGDPFAVMNAAFKDVSPTAAERDAIRHLMLLFYRRGLASPAGDERALRVAWSSRSVSRVVRLAYLAIPDAFDRWRGSEETVDPGD